MELINQQIKSFIKTSPNDQELTHFLNEQLTPNLKPQINFNKINPNTITKPTLVYAKVMVQDIRDAYFYISFAMKRPFNPEEPYFLYKYGHQPQSQPENVHQNKEYINVFTDRYTVVGTPIRYQTKWVDQAQGKANDFDQILVQVDGQAHYKLGQILNMVAFYDPYLKKLFMVRQIDIDQAIQAELQVNTSGKQLSVEESEVIRNQLMNWLCSYCSDSFAQFLIFALLSEEPFFLGAEADVSSLISELYPRVAHIKLVHPCNKPFFPFKNQEGELTLTEMQMSSLPTFVSIDFSEFSSQQKVVVQGTSLMNLSGLKLFVEEGKTTYRWQIGQANYQHKHRGIIVKASKLINPTFHPKNQKISLQFGNLNTVTQAKKQEFRSYLKQVSSVNPSLEDDERKKIQKELLTINEKQKLGSKLMQVMSLSKLRAKSFGRVRITVQDFNRCVQLVQQCEDLV